MGVVAENARRIGVMYAGRIVETADRTKIFRNPAHPYTVRLLQSLPDVDKRSQALQTIEGRVPRATEWPSGCRFQPRCHKAFDACPKVDPELYAVEPEHQAACLLYDERTAGRKASTSEVAAAPEPRPRAPQGAEGTALVTLRGLQVHFPIRRGVLQRTVGHVRAVDGVDAEIHRGKTLGLVGESGCGKTTLGKALLQLVRPTGGQVLYDGTDLTTLSRAELLPYRRRMQIVFQDPYSSLNPRMMVGEIIEEGMKVHSIGADRDERRELMGQILERVGLDPGMIHRYPHEFSGGQRQRISIARALAVDPEFIICDEATSALDVSVQAQILNLLEGLQAERNLTYLFITHDLSVVEYLSDGVAVMYLGRIVEYGPTERIFREPRHPYTRALLAAVPKIDPETGARKIRLGGDVPSPVKPPSGCHFHPRCAEAMPHCSGQYPPDFEVGPNHVARCYLYDPARPKAETAT
jgi:peptide/nickel transport system ATP-binding protein